MRIICWLLVVMLLSAAAEGRTQGSPLQAAAEGRIQAAPLQAVALGQEDVADVPSEDLRVGANEKQRHFLIGAKEKAPAGGYGLLVVLPGGDGSAEFNGFVKRVWKQALPEGWLVAQLVAVASDDQRQIVWPTRKTPHAKQGFSTEEFVAGVIGEVKKKHALDEKRVMLLGWSSGGPAVYAAVMEKGSMPRGGYVAMSVFVPNRLPALAGAKGKRFFLLQSPEDQVTKFLFAERAKKELSAAGAAVKLKEYEGGHGWRGDVFGNIREGVGWVAGQE